MPPATDEARVRRDAVPPEDDSEYRYQLRRTWDPRRPAIGWVMLNPSTASARRDDPTIRRVLRFSAAWGYGAVVVTNLYALRATRPAELAGHPSPVGPENATHLLRSAAETSATVCAWGAHRLALPRAPEVLRLLAAAELLCLGLTRAGQPRHPLYVPAATTAVRFAVPRAAR
jgi:hypothetical protein